MAFTALNNKWINLDTVLSEICIGINERRAAIDVTLIDFVIDRDSNTSQFPDPGDFDLRFYGQEFADIQQVITDEVKKVSYVSETGGGIIYVSAIPDYTGTLPIDAAPQDTITDTLDPDQWAWYISELNKKTKVRIATSTKTRTATTGIGTAITDNASWNNAIGNLSTAATTDLFTLEWGITTLTPTTARRTDLRSAENFTFNTANYLGVVSDGRISFSEEVFGLTNLATENRSMQYVVAGSSFTSQTSPVFPNATISTPKAAFYTPTQGIDNASALSINNLGTTSAFTLSPIPPSPLQAGLIRLRTPLNLFHSDISGELTDQA